MRSMLGKTRYPRVLMAAGAAAVLGSLLLSGPASASPGTGFLRLAHLSPNTPAVDVYLYSFGDPSARLVLHHVAYGTVSGYQPVAGGQYTVAMRLAGASKHSPPVLSASVAVAAGGAYTVAGMGPAKGLRLQILRDRLAAPARAAVVRVIQASLRQHRVTVRADGRVLASHQAFATVTSYRAVAAGKCTITAAGATESRSQVFMLAADTVHTLVVLDGPAGLEIANLEDAAGSRALPAGAPATGLGGTAPVPSPSPVPWLITTAAGLLLAGAGVVRLRRTAAAGRGR
jgi:hypothetical protein